MPAFLPIVSKFDSTGIDKGTKSLKKFSGVAGKVGKAAAAAVGAVAAVGIREFAQFDAALNKSLAIMGDVSQAMEKDMSDAAREVAKATSFSAEEAAESFFFLASAGLDAEASVAAMPQVAAFAQAGMFDMATATDLATDAQSALGLASDDAQQNLDNLTRVTDVFVKANTLANTSVEQLATALTTKAGNALKTVGKDVEEGAAALAVFADQGIKGERAGTLLTNTIFGLTDIMKKAPAEAEALGIEVFNAAGEMNSFADISADLTEALSSMTKEQQIATLDSLGFTKQAREGTLALLGQSEQLKTYETELRNAGGTAQEVAEKQLDTLIAQFGILKDSAIDVGLEIGGVLAPHLQTLIEVFIPIVQDLAPKLGDGLRNLETGFQAVGERVGIVVDIFENLRENLGIGDAIEFLSGQFGLLGKKIIENLGSAFVNFMQFRADLTANVLAALPGIFEAITTFLPQLITFLAEEVLPMIVKQLAGTAEQLVTVISEALPGLITAISEVIPDLVQAIADLIPKILETLMGLIPQLLEGALQFFTAIVDAVQLIVPKLITTVTELIPKIIETFVTMLPQIIEGALNLFNGIITALVETIPILIEAFVENFPMVLEALVGALPQIIEAALELFFGIVTALVDSVPKIITAIVEMIPDLTETLVDALPEIISASMDLFFGIIEGLLDATPDIIEAIIDMIPKLTTALLDNLPQLIEAGFQLLSGIAEGILTNLPRVAANLARSIGDAITGKVKGVFGIQSPSVVFMGLGEELVAGLSKGMTDGRKELEKASVSMASTVQVSAEDTLRATSANFDTQASSSQTPAPVNITINAGTGTDPVAVGRAVVEAIKRYEAVSGKVFVSA